VPALGSLCGGEAGRELALSWDPPGGGGFGLLAGGLLSFAGGTGGHRPFSGVASVSEGAMNAVNLLAACLWFRL